MIIAIVSSYALSGRGGMESSTGIAIRELEKRGDTVHIIMRSGKIDTTWSTEFNCHYINDAGKQLQPFVFPYKLTMLLNRLKPDLVLGLDKRAVSYSRFYRYLHPNKVRIGSWMRFALLTLGKNPGKHLKYADFHLAISSDIANDLNRIFEENSKPIYLVFNPVQLAEKTIIRPIVPTFLYVGRLVIKQKQVHHLLQALAGLKGTWKAIIIGDGIDASKLKQLARDLGIYERIEWRGWLVNPWDEVTESSALILTSAYEGFGNVLVEALNRGLPCISSKSPAGPSDIIINGENGWLYPLDDLKILTELMQRIVDNPLSSLPDPQFVKKTGERFAAEKIVSGLRKALVAQVGNL